MDWLAAGENGPLIAIRAIHFAVSALTTGTLVFGTVAGNPALRSEPQLAVLQRTQMLRLAWIGLAITVSSGVIWLWFQAASIAGLPLGEALTLSLLLTVLNETQFGLVWEIRMVLAVILAACLACDRFAPANWLALAAAICLTAAIAWTGHAGSTAGELGKLHLTADVLHLTAAAAWIARRAARRGSACSGCRTAVAGLGGDEKIFHAGGDQRGDAPDNRHRQRLDPGRLV
jgi:putative copper resistance protein D